MDKYTYKEMDKGKEIDRIEYLSTKNLSDVSILCKYYRAIGLDKQESLDKIFDICRKNIVGFDSSGYKGTIENMVIQIYAKKKEPIQVDSISIYKEELEFINSLNIKYNSKKLLFAFLCFKKIEYELTEGKTSMDYYAERDYKTKNLKEMFGVRTDIDMMIFYLAQHGLVENAYNTDTKLLFMNMIGERKEVAFVIDRFDTVSLYFDRYNNKCKVIECDVCGKLIKPKGKTSPQKYCDICARYIKNENNKKYYKDNLGKTY